MEDREQKNHVIYVLISGYQSNPKETVWNSCEKFMSLVEYL